MVFEELRKKISYILKNLGDLIFLNCVFGLTGMSGCHIPVICLIIIVKNVAYNFYDIRLAGCDLPSDRGVNS